MFFPPRVSDNYGELTGLVCLTRFSVSFLEMEGSRSGPVIPVTEGLALFFAKQTLGALRRVTIVGFLGCGRVHRISFVFST